MKRIAIIDLGTNTFHLLVADVSSSHVQVVHKEKQSVKIGAGGINLGKITPSAQERALKKIHEFKKTMDLMGVEISYATATSAFRNASNGRLLADDIFSQTGIKVDIIDGQQEAGLIYLGVKQALYLGTSNALIVDVGGGSVEFIIGNHQNIQWKDSFEIGAQRLMDKFHLHDPILDYEIESLNSFLDTQLVSLASAMERYQPETLVGSSGSFDTLSHIYCLKQGMDKSDKPEQPLSISGFEEIHNEIVLKNRADRLKIPGMIGMRVDMIVVASSLIKYLLDRFSMTTIRVSSYALKEGVLHDVVVKVQA